MEELIQKRNVENHLEIIQGLVNNLKKKNLKFTQYEKERLLDLHKQKEESQTINHNAIQEDQESINEERDNSDNDENEEVERIANETITDNYKEQRDS